MGTYSIANSAGFKSIYNPLINASLNTKNESGYTDVTDEFYIEWNPVKDLRLVGQVGITRQTTTGEIYLPKDHTNYKDIDIDSDQYFLRG